MVLGSSAADRPHQVKRFLRTVKSDSAWEVSAFLAGVTRTQPLFGPRLDAIAGCTGVLQSKNCSRLFTVLFRYLEEPLCAGLVDGDFWAYFCGNELHQHVRGAWLARLEVLLPPLEKIAYFAHLGYFFRASARERDLLDLIRERDALLWGARQYQKPDPEPTTFRAKLTVPDLQDARNPVDLPAVQAVLRGYSWGQQSFTPNTPETAKSSFHAAFELRQELARLLGGTAWQPSRDIPVQAKPCKVQGTRARWAISPKPGTLADFIGKLSPAQLNKLSLDQFRLLQARLPRH